MIAWLLVGPPLPIVDEPIYFPVDDEPTALDSPPSFAEGPGPSNTEWA